MKKQKDIIETLQKQVCDYNNKLLNYEKERKEELDLLISLDKELKILHEVICKRIKKLEKEK